MGGLWWLLSPVEDFARLALGLKDAVGVDGVRHWHDTPVCVFFLVVFTCEWTASPIIMAALSQRSYVSWLAMCFYFLAVVFNADASASMIFTTPSGLYYLSLK
jgi:hypothetical protein